MRDIPLPVRSTFGATAWRRAFVRAIFGVLVLLVAHQPILAQNGGDRIVLSRFDGYSEAQLPGGPHGPVVPIGLTPEAMEIGADGTLYAVAGLFVFGNVTFNYYIVSPAGSIETTRTLAIGPQVSVLDLALTTTGELYLLTVASHPIQGLFVDNLFKIDRTTGTVLGVLELGEARVQAIAPAPNGGLWAITNDGLAKLDPTSGIIYPTGASLPQGFYTLAADTDSGGALWLVQEALIVSPPFFRLARLDPVTGTLRPASFALGIGPSALAIRPGCEQTATARCLLGGRFRATVTWRDFADRRGAGQVTPRGSADSALFWFFDPSNWEILVKMVEGCEENGHYWVFAAGTTDVEHTLEIMDLATGQVFTASNPLGQASAAVTDIRAFAGCP